MSFPLVLMHRSARIIHFCCVFVFVLRFVKLGFTVLKGSFLVTVWIAILDQVCRVHEMLPIKITKLFVNREVNSFKHESESSSKSILFVGEFSWVVLEQYWVQDTSAALIVQSQSCRMNRKIERNKWAFHKCTVLLGIFTSVVCLSLCCVLSN